MTRTPRASAASARPTRRQVLGWGAGVGSTVLLAGCGSATPQVDTGPPFEGGYDGPPLQIEYWTGFTGGDGPSMRQLVADFNDSQDLITVRMNVVQWAQYYQRTIAAVHAGRGPDVGALQVDQLATLAERQVVNPLDAVVEELGLRAQDYPEEVWERSAYDGQRFGIPLDVHSLGSYANVDLVDPAGGSPAPATAEELGASLRAVQQAGLENPFWMPNRWPAHLIFLSLLWQWGGEPYAEDGSAATFDSDEGVQALEWMVDQVQSGISPPDVAVDSQYTAFKNGDVAYTWDGIWQINDLRDTAQDLEWQLAPVPTVGPETAVWASSHQLVQFRQRNPDPDRLLAGKAFLDFLVTESGAWSAAGMIPAASAAREEAEFLESPQAAVATVIDEMRFLPPVPALGEVQVQTLEIAVADAVLGRAEPADALAGAATQATALMEANQRKFGRGA